MPGLIRWFRENNDEEAERERELERERNRRIQELTEALLNDEDDDEDDHPPGFQPHRANTGNPQGIMGHTTTEFQTEPQPAEPEAMEAEPEPEPEVDTRQWTTINYEDFRYGSKSKYTKDKEKLDI